MLNCAPQHYIFSVHQPRKSDTSGYYRCVEAHFEDLKAVWDDRYVRKYGFCVLATDVEQLGTVELFESAKFDSYEGQ